VKALVILLLACAILAGGAFFTYELFIKPEKMLREEKLLPPEPPPPDPTLPEFEKALKVHKSGKLIEARTALEFFIEHFPESSKLEEARDLLGDVNTKILFSPVPSPEKQLYIVRSGDVLNRVAAKTKSTAELIMRSNHLTGTMLRIDQKLWVPPTQFSITISRKRNKIVLFRANKYFKQYPIRSWPPVSAKKAAAPPQKLTGRVTERIAWYEGQRVIFIDKGYNEATHWIQLSIPGYTIYGEPAPGDTKAQKPPSGIVIAPEAAAELAAMLSKNEPVSIE
jgi:LysM repeat protein